MKPEALQLPRRQSLKRCDLLTVSDPWTVSSSNFMMRGNRASMVGFLPRVSQRPYRGAEKELSQRPQAGSKRWNGAAAKVEVDLRESRNPRVCYWAAQPLVPPLAYNIQKSTRLDCQFKEKCVKHPKKALNRSAHSHFTCLLVNHLRLRQWP